MSHATCDIKEDAAVARATRPWQIANKINYLSVWRREQLLIMKTFVRV